MLSAIEAREQFSITHSTLLIRAKGKDKATILYLIERSGNWDNVRFVSTRSSYGLSWIFLIRSLKKSFYDCLFLRAFPLASYFINNLNHNIFYLLDDGNATINIANEFREAMSLTSRLSLFGLKKDKFKYRLIEQVYKLFGIGVVNNIKKVNFFTFYELDPIANQNVVPNNFLWLNTLKSINKTKVLEDTVFVVGTNVVNALIISEEAYFNYLKRSKNHHRKFQKCTYIPHLRESEKFLKRIQLELGYEIRKTKYNLELDFLLQNEIPVHLTGSISTALLTMKLMYTSEINVTYMKFNQSTIQQSFSEDIERMYAFQSRYIRVIN